jgi:hypothetical protein
MAKKGGIKIKRPGALTAKAKRAHMSLSAFEQKHKHDSGLTGKQARFAINAKKFHHSKRGR